MWLQLVLHGRATGRDDQRLRSGQERLGRVAVDSCGSLRAWCAAVAPSGPGVSHGLTDPHAPTSTASPCRSANNPPGPTRPQTSARARSKNSTANSSVGIFLAHGTIDDLHGEQVERYLGSRCAAAASTSRLRSTERRRTVARFERAAHAKQPTGREIVRADPK